MIPVLAWSLALTRPLWLLVLLAAPVFGYLTWRASRGRPRACDWSALIIRTLLLLIVAAALAAPRIELEARFRSVAYLLDVSESIPPRDRERMADFIQRSAAHRGPDDDVALVVVADGAAVETPFSRISVTERVDDIVLDPHNVTSLLPAGESDLDAGLGLARAIFPPGGARRVVLFTDGNQTRGDAVSGAKALLTDNVDLMVVPVRYKREREVHVRKLVAPPTAARGHKVPFRAVIHSTHPRVDARIRFFVDGEEVVARDEQLEQGDNVFEMGYEFDTDAMHRIEVRVEPAQDGDALLWGESRRVLAESSAEFPGSLGAGSLRRSRWTGAWRWLSFDGAAWRRIREPARCRFSEMGRWGCCLAGQQEACV